MIKHAQIAVGRDHVATADGDLADHVGRFGQHVEIAGLGRGLYIVRIEPETGVFLHEFRRNALAR